MKHSITIALLLTLLRTAHADDAAKLPYAPGTASLAVVLGPNMSSDKWKEQKVKEALRAQTEVERLFAERGYQIVKNDDVAGAVAKVGFDCTSEEQWTKLNLYKIGNELNTEMVAFVVIKQTRQKIVQNILQTHEEGEAEIEVWLVDAKQSQPILNDVAARGISRGGVRSTSPRRLAAVSFAVDEPFAGLLRGLPKVKSTEDRK